MYGANADSLEHAGVELNAAADELDSSAKQLASTLGSLSWLGQVAVRFMDMWNTRHAAEMQLTSSFLRENAQKLYDQAKQQREASNSMGAGGSGGGWFEKVQKTMDAAVQAAIAAAKEAQRLRAVADGLADEVQAARGMSDAEQAAWWNSLTDDQRLALLTMRPGELTALHGLPEDVRQQAQDNYTSSIADQIVTESASIHAEIEADIKIVKVGAGFDIEQRTYQDGSVQLDMAAFVKAGVGFDVGFADGEALAKAGIGGVWEFDSQEDADRFIEGLKREIVPGWKEVLRAGGNVGAASTASLLNYLKDNGDHLGSVSSSVGVEGSVGLSGNEVGASAGVGVSVDTRGENAGEVTISANASVSGRLAPHGGTLGVSGDLEISASATFDGTTPKNITFSMAYENAALTGVFTPVGEVSVGATQSGTAQISFDLTRPEVQSAAIAATAALKRGDVVAATQALAGVMDQAQITVQTAVGVETNAKFDAKVVSGGVTANVSTTTSTLVKPPGGSFYEVK